MRKNFYLLIALLLITSQLGWAEGSKNLTPNAIGGNETGINDFIGYLLVDGISATNLFMKPGAPATQRLYVTVKPGETIYYGVRRMFDTYDQYYTNQDVSDLRIRLKYQQGATITAVQGVILQDAVTPRHRLAPQQGVIDTYAEALAGPQQAGNAGGYDALSWTNNLGFTVDLFIEFTHPRYGDPNSDEEGYRTAGFGTNTSRYDLFDFSVYDANGVERTGRLRSAQWVFSSSSFARRLSKDFSFFAAVDAPEGGYYVRKANYAGAQPFEAIYVANSTGSDPAAHPGGSDYTDYRQSQNQADGFTSDDIYPEYPLFVSNPDPELYPTASTQALTAVASNSFCDGAGNGKMALNLFSSKAGVGTIIIDLDQDGVFDAEDRLLEQLIVAGNNYFYWDGLDGTGAPVASGTEIQITFRSNVRAIHFPIWDVETNANGMTVQQVRPGINGDYEYLYYDDSNLPAGIISPATQLEGNNSAAGAHVWEDTSGDNTGGGNERIMNTFTYGSIVTQTVTKTHTYNCNPDYDGDGVLNTADADDDNDGISDLVELNGLPDPYGFAGGALLPYYLDNTNAGFIDYDGNGIDDRYDADGDGILNINDTDSDGDGLWDAIDNNNTRAPSVGGYDMNTGTTTGTDNNGNGMADGAEGVISLNDRDGDSIADPYDMDSDNDGVLDLYEGTGNARPSGGRDYWNTDSDGDGVYDIIEAGGVDSNGDGRVDGFTDLNKNGLHDGYESLMGGVELGDPDSDGDGLVNRIELDSDNDGIPDTAEGNGDFDGDGINNVIDLDSDNDGLYDVYEAGGTAGANGRLSSFTDANTDGYDDATAASPLPLPNTDGTGSADYRDADSDGDGISDVLEAGARDSNGDGQIDGTVNNNGLVQSIDPASGGRALPVVNTDGDALADYRDTDSDGDGFLDAVEGFDTNFDNSADRSPVGTDTDGDGLDNAFDTSNGGVASTQPDLDGDGIPNYQDIDDDGDGTNSSVEGAGGNPPAYLYNPAAQQYVIAPSSSATKLARACYQLSSGGNQRSAVWSNLQIDISKPFILEANLNFGTSNNRGAGIAVVFHTDSRGTSALGQNGPAFIGYGGSSAITPSRIFEFDTDKSSNGNNGYDGNGSDHFDYMANGAHNNPITGYYLNNLEDGADHALRIVHTGTETSVYIDGIRVANALTTVASGLGNGNVYWGFTASTENQGNTQSVCNINMQAGDDLPDHDNDGIADIIDTDDDGDGILDTQESNGVDPLADADNDGVPNYQDPSFAPYLDNNGDGINDIFDVDLDGQMNHLDLDADNDGIADSTEGTADSDGDGIPDNRDLDSDNDGIADLVEVGGTDSNGDGKVDGFFDYNDNGLADMLDPAEGNTSLTPIDTDGDGVNDYRDLDSDNDGIADLIELHQLDTDENGQVDSFADANYNGLKDALEGNAVPLHDLDGDGTFNHHDLDSDGDNISDRLESYEADAGNDGLADAFVDSNGDGWHDSYLYNTINTQDWDGDGALDFLDLDSDNDGILDAQEAVADGAYTARLDGSGKGTVETARFMPPFTASLVDTDGDGIPDIRDADSDNDGLTDATEAGASDSDGDGVVDGFSDNSPTVSDGLHDAFASSPLAVNDTDADGARDFRDRDSDNDGQADWIEAYDTDGNRDALAEYLQYSLDYFDYTGDNDYDNSIDTNGDGVPDWLEDDDADGFPNFQDPDHATYYLDTDNNGLVNLYDAAFGGVENKPNNEAYTDPGTVGTLPVELLSFTAREDNGRVLVSWSTAQEINNDYFLVQRSVDGKEFITIGERSGAGNSEQELSYQFIDHEPLAGLTYYRLVQVDYDGASESFDPVSVQIKVFWQVVAFPNPSASSQNVKLRISSDEAQYVSLEVSDLNGYRIWSRSQRVEAGTNGIEIPARALPASGIYLLKISNNINSQVIKLLRK